MFDITVAAATIKAIAAVAKGAGNIQLYNDIITLQGAILEQQSAAVALHEENAALRRELHDFKEQQRLQAELSFEQNVYWRGASGTPRDGPYCPKCLGTSVRAVRMADRADDHWWRCSVCDTSVAKPGPDPQQFARSDYHPHNRL